MLDPPVLLLDEPMGALDPMIRAHLQDDLKRIFRELKKTVLLVTHDLGEAAFLGDEIAILHDGSVVQKGTAKDLVRRPKNSFVSEFLNAQRPRWLEELERP
jgi:osmoprotectant transport system ATP-binding protein